MKRKALEALAEAAKRGYTWHFSVFRDSVKNPVVYTRLLNPRDDAIGEEVISQEISESGVEIERIMEFAAEFLENHDRK